MSRPNRDDRNAGRPEAGSDRDQQEGGFLCVHCGALVPHASPGTSQRNHCPHCLWSLHVDLKPGDRRALCRSPMEPVALWVSPGEELRLIHRCTGCGVLKPNRIAGDDTEAAIDELAGRLHEARGRRPQGPPAGGSATA